MRDVIRQDGRDDDTFKRSSWSNVSDSSVDAHATPDITAVEDIQRVVSKYVGQLLYGCNDGSCTEILCDTGRRNSSPRPLRKYTPRSARAVALAIVSGPRPHAHLCSRYNHETRHKDRCPIAEGRRDPSAFVQQLSDAKVVRTLCDPLCDLSKENLARPPLDSLTLTGDENQIKLAERHTDLERQVKAAATALLEGDFTVLEHVAGYLLECLLDLRKSQPPGQIAQWQYANDIISSGCAYPSQNQDVPCDSSYNTWLEILDGLEHPPFCRLLCHTLDVAARVYDLSCKACETLPATLMSQTARKNGPWCLIHRLIDAILPYGCKLLKSLSVIVWLKKAFLHHWRGETRVSTGSIPFIALTLMQRMSEVSAANPDNYETDLELLHISVLAARMDAIELAQSWIEGPRENHLLSFNFLFTLSQQATYFRTVNHLRMRKVVTGAKRTSELRRQNSDRLSDVVLTAQGQLKHIEETYLLLSVTRGNILQDTFNQLWQRRQSELLRPLRVRLGEIDTFEVGHDLGGVQIEFFNLICKELFSESLQMFTTDPSTGYSYFRPGSLQPPYMFELCGLLFALALYNGITLPIYLPKAFYYILTEEFAEGANVSTHMIADAWPVVKRSLDAILQSDVAGIDMTFPLEANGLRLTTHGWLTGESELRKGASERTLSVIDATPIVHHDDEAQLSPSPNDGSQSASTPHVPNIDVDSISTSWPGWKLVKAPATDKELTADTKARYVSDYIHWLTHHSVRPQWTSFQRGFKHIFPDPPSDLSLLSLPNLNTLLEGSPNFSLTSIKQITEYENFNPQGAYIQSFWRIVTAWPESKQKQLLKFVTACERIPAGGAGNLTFKIKRGPPPDEGQLPTSSTCFGMLVLPKYESAEVLERKLNLALKYGLEGFGSA